SGRIAWRPIDAGAGGVRGQPRDIFRLGVSSGIARLAEDVTGTRRRRRADAAHRSLPRSGRSAAARLSWRALCPQRPVQRSWRAVANGARAQPEVSEYRPDDRRSAKEANAGLTPRVDLNPTGLPIDLHTKPHDPRWYHARRTEIARSGSPRDEVLGIRI